VPSAGLDLAAIARSVVARGSEAVIVPFRQVGMTGNQGEPDWHPRPKFCHDNVAIWVARSPQHKHIRGYLIFDLRFLFGFWRVVELEDGALIDITPSGASQLYPFVRHTGTEEEFAEMACVIVVDVPDTATVVAWVHHSARPLAALWLGRSMGRPIFHTGKAIVFPDA
jgi:hypothetical protein